MLKQNTINLLKSSKNLLAFSAGVDSTALFFLLLQSEIAFDIAIVDYNMRAASKDEVQYARELAQIYGKRIYEHSIILTSSNFEAQARAARYKFFEYIVISEGYETLVTAHQLNDKTEWLLMRFCSGSGLSSMFGMGEIEYRSDCTYVRPLIDATREDIVSFLRTGNIKYFQDESNDDEKYTRNYFRKQFSNTLVAEFAIGIRKSFEILSSEKEALYGDVQIFQEQQLIISNPRGEVEILHYLDMCLKKLGYMISSAQRVEFLRTKNCVLGGKFVAVFEGGKLFISPVSSVMMDKKFKEQCRGVSLPVKIRPYLYQINIDPLVLNSAIGLFFVGKFGSNSS